MFVLRMHPENNFHFQHRKMPCLVSKCSASYSGSFGAYWVKIRWVAFVLCKLYRIPFVWHILTAWNIPPSSLFTSACILSANVYTFVVRENGRDIYSGEGGQRVGCTTSTVRR